MSILLSDLFSKNKQPAAAINAAIVDVNLTNFQKEVLEGSLSTLVLLDFWAPWCGPCKTLTPILEKLTATYDGKVKLAKINIDEHQQLAAQFRIQSVPTVIAFYQGRPVDAFAGALPESQIKQFIEKIIGAPDGNVDTLLKEAEDYLAADNFDQAAMMFQEILTQFPDAIPALTGLARCHALTGNLEIANTIITPIATTPEAISTVKLLEILAYTQEITQMPTQDVQDEVFKSAMNAFARRQYETCITELLSIIKTQPEWKERLAITTLFNSFLALGNDHPLTLKGRRQLAAILYV